MKNKKDLLQWMKPFKKLDARDLGQVKFKTKEYFEELNLYQARTKFAIDTKMSIVLSLLTKSMKNSRDNVNNAPELTALGILSGARSLLN